MNGVEEGWFHSLPGVDRKTAAAGWLRFGCRGAPRLSLSAARSESYWMLGASSQAPAQESPPQQTPRVRPQRFNSQESCLPVTVQAPTSGLGQLCSRQFQALDRRWRRRGLNPRLLIGMSCSVLSLRFNNVSRSRASCCAGNKREGIRCYGGCSAIGVQG